MALAYVLWLPVSQVEILYPMLGVLAATGLLNAVWFHRSWRPEFRLCWFLLVAVVVSWALLGSLRDNAGLLHQCLVFLGGTTIWGLWSLGLGRKDIRLVLSVVAGAVGAISLLIVLYVLEQQGLSPVAVPKWVVLTQSAGFGLDTDGTAIRFLSLSTLAAGGPFVIACAVARRDVLLPNRGLCLVASVLAFGAAYLSGRRAILAVMTVSLVLVAFSSLYLRSRQRRSGSRYVPAMLLILSLLAMAVLPALGGLVALPRPFRVVVEGAVLLVTPGLVSSSSVADTARVTQARELVAGWSDEPFLGAGLGARLPDGFVRNADRPWMFELQYHQMVFQIGLLGTMLVIAAFVAALVGIRRVASAHPQHQPTVAACLVAAASLLITNASNPYLQTPGHWWGVVLVLGVTNALSSHDLSSHALSSHALSSHDLSSAEQRREPGSDLVVTPRSQHRGIRGKVRVRPAVSRPSRERPAAMPWDVPSPSGR